MRGEQGRTCVVVGWRAFVRGVLKVEVTRDHLFWCDAPARGIHLALGPFPTTTRYSTTETLVANTARHWSLLLLIASPLPGRNTRTLSAPIGSFH